MVAKSIILFHLSILKNKCFDCLEKKYIWNGMHLYGVNFGTHTHTHTYTPVHFPKSISLNRYDFWKFTWNPLRHSLKWFSINSIVESFLRLKHCFFHALAVCNVSDLHPIRPFHIVSFSNAIAVEIRLFILFFFENSINSLRLISIWSI